MGNQAWTQALEWPGAKAFRSAPMKDFKVKSNGQIAGEYKGAEGMTFMRVSNCSYLRLTLHRYLVQDICNLLLLSPYTDDRVPYDQPENSLAIFNEWLARAY
jgi:cathepsin A (carboxypeptidase C)